jgi:hypothetical protein
VDFPDPKALLREKSCRFLMIIVFGIGQNTEWDLIGSAAMFDFADHTDG